MRAVAIGIAVVALRASATANAQADDEVPNSPRPRDAAPAAPPATQEDLAALRAELASQQIAVDRLRSSEAARAHEPPLVRVSGYAQIDWIVHDQASQNEIDDSSGQPLNQDRFTLRRGHVRFDAQRGLFAGVLELDANTVNGPQVRPIDAEVSFRWPAPSEGHPPLLVAAMGLMKIPFGFEVPELDNVRPFLERSTVMRALFPGEFDLGARLGGTYRAFEWALAVMNGNPIGDKVFPALAPGRTKELVGRIGTRADVAPGVHFEAGISGDTGLGFHAGTPTTKDVVVWHDDNGDGIVQATEIGVIPGSAATASQQFRRFAVGADARLTVRLEPLGELALRAEIGEGTEPRPRPRVRRPGGRRTRPARVRLVRRRDAGGDALGGGGRALRPVRPGRGRERAERGASGARGSHLSHPRADGDASLRGRAPSPRVRPQRQSPRARRERCAHDPPRRRAHAARTGDVLVHLRRAPPRLVACLVATGLCALAACLGSGATDNRALGSRMRIEGAQFVRGPMPAVAAGAPKVDALDLATSTVWPGEVGKPVSGSLGPSATSAALALSDDEGYWIVPAGPPDVSAPDLPTFHATASFATTLAAGDYSLQVRAIDANGAFGAPSAQTLDALASAPSAPPPEGALVVTLTWDTESDLDLHVVDPSGDEIDYGAPLSFGADGGVSGQLDFDSNGNCLIDGRREEDVTWAGPPPAGHYVVRFDTPSLCGQPIAHWAARATLRGQGIGEATGVSLNPDTWGPHDHGAGLLALQFDVP